MEDKLLCTPNHTYFTQTHLLDQYILSVNLLCPFVDGNTIMTKKIRLGSFLLRMT